jgi:hypothetical protein
MYLHWEWTSLSSGHFVQIDQAAAHIHTGIKEEQSTQVSVT